MNFSLMYLHCEHIRRWELWSILSAIMWGIWDLICSWDEAWYWILEKIWVLTGFLVSYTSSIPVASMNFIQEWEFIYPGFNLIVSVQNTCKIHILEVYSIEEFPLLLLLHKLLCRLEHISIKFIILYDPK